MRLPQWLLLTAFIAAIVLLWSLRELLLLKSDRELAESFAFDLRFQHALDVSAPEDRVISERSIAGFRARLAQGDPEGRLLQSVFSSISETVVRRLALSTKEQRTDSTFVTSNIQRRNRESFYHGGDARVGVGRRRRDYGVEEEEDDTSIPEEERADAQAWRAERRKEDAVAEAQQLEERRASYRRASVAWTETPAFEDDSTTDEESDDDARVKKRRGSTILACELPWYLKRRDVVSSWRAYKQSTYLVTEWLPAEKARPKGKDKKSKKGKKDAAPITATKSILTQKIGECA